ncbi:MAG: type II toxin-antitoxin system RelB/DinJ family antitoxin [Candidatus Daviesbacteria bacterium]|nr:type II toxin-antitoxin system RelB/DinJ family antitoxin [Candidatus Daviesbacteria bacterium]
MSYAVVTTKVDPEMKKQAQKAAAELGVPLSLIIKGLLKQFIKTKTITFNGLDEEPSEYLIKSIKQAEKNLKAGRHSPVFKTGEEAVAWLEKQGV